MNFRSNRLVKQFASAFVDLLPIIGVILFFQLLVLRQPFPQVADLMVGSLLVVAGLAFFIEGLEMSLFPLGENLAHDFARKGSLFWLLLFAFGLGFGTTVAKPSLIAVAEEAARVAATGGLIPDDLESLDRYSQGLRYTVALSVGVAIFLGVLRILLDWSLPLLIIGGYALIGILTLFAPADIIGIAYDSGGVTTSTVTVPLVTALGIGLASSIKGRDPMVDGFGLIAFASLFPIMFVMIYGMLVH
ncbi:MAG: DUF1538 domain-containing protein [Immundisolibacteraceae bacterium]|nr:DUF1538 domain-containing protein [Immundisolibacteraceae bacterium]